MAEAVGGAKLELRLDYKEFVAKANEAASTSESMGKRIKAAFYALEAPARAQRSMDSWAEAIKRVGGVAQLSAAQLKILEDRVGGLVSKGATLPAVFSSMGGSNKGLEVIAQQANQLAAGAYAAGPSVGSLVTGLAAMGPAGMAAAAGIGVLVGAVVGVEEAMRRSIGAAIEWGENVENTSVMLGITTDEVQKLSYAAKILDVDSSSLSRAMNMLQDALTSAPEKLSALGLSAQQLKEQSPVQALEQVIEAVKGLRTQSDQFAAMADIFGARRASELMLLLKGDLGATMEEAKRYGTMLDTDMVGAMAKLEDETARVGAVWQSFKINLGAAIASSPQFVAGIRSITDALADLVKGLGYTAKGLSLIGAGIGGGISTVLNPSKISEQWGKISSALGLGSTRGAGFSGGLGIVAGNVANLFGPGGPEIRGPVDELAVRGGRSYASKGAEERRKATEAAKEEARRRREALEAYIQELKLEDAQERELAKVTQAIVAEGQKELEDTLAMIAKAGERGGVAQAFAGGTWARADVWAQIQRDEAEVRRETIENEKATLSWDQALQNVVNSFELMGVSSSSTFGKILGLAPTVSTAIANLGKGPGGLISGVASLAGAGIGLIGSLFGGGKKEKEALREMYRGFVDSAGGIDKLRASADAAGVSIEALFRQKNKTGLQAAIDDITGKLSDWDAAQAGLDDAIQKYGFSIAELGPKWKQQELDEQASALLKDYNLLTASGIDQTLVIQKMGSAYNEYIQTAVGAGVAIPEAMRGTVDKMIELGLLTDAEGNAFASAEAAGISFTTTLTEGLMKSVAAIDRLVEAIYRAAGIPMPSVQGIPEAPSAPSQAALEGMMGSGYPYAGSFALGSGGFKDFGRGALAVLHGQEAVVRKDAAPSGLTLNVQSSFVIEARGGGADIQELERAVTRAQAQAIRLGSSELIDAWKARGVSVS